MSLMQQHLSLKVNKSLILKILKIKITCGTFLWKIKCNKNKYEGICFVKSTYVICNIK